MSYNSTRYYNNETHKVVPKDAVVLDFHAGPDSAKALVGLLRSNFWMGLADQPPRIPEPGLWGVVAAVGQGLDEVHWVRTKADPPWLAVNHGRYAEWQQLKDPVLIRPGV